MVESVRESTVGQGILVTGDRGNCLRDYIP